MELEKAIEKINELLKDNNITAEFAMNQVGYKKTKFNILIRNKYKYNRNKRQYEVIKEGDREVKKEVDTIKPIKNERQTEGIKMAFTDEEIEILKGIIETHKKVIEVPKGGDDNFKTTIRINDKIWTAFNKFCKKNKSKSKREHLANAIIKYINEK